ncbi:DNA gyrase inhibitor YacG [Maioricimonas sp. JC845]|uniref:DNA gyrase inhibitor YacG n=1 Tax=Maioricimonas sp. JC845 TaxID=3232138 RepID=UPI00345794E6
MISARTCPICDAELAPEAAGESPTFPFCSARCKQIDLLRWCNGDYAIVERLTPEKLAEQSLDDPLQFEE